MFVFTTGHQIKKKKSNYQFTGAYEKCYHHSLHAPMHADASSHHFTNIHSGTHVTPVTAPIRNGIIKQIPLALLKERIVRNTNSRKR